MLYTIFLVIDVLIAIALVVLVLLHRSRGSEVGAAFAGGGGASGSVFGSRGASSFMTRLIAILSVLFLSNSLLLTYVANRDFAEAPIIEQVEAAAQRQAAEQEVAAAEQAEQEAAAADTDDTVPEVPN